VLGDAALAFDQLAHQRGKREDIVRGHDLSGLRARDFEHVVDMVQKLPPRRADDVEVFDVLGIAPFGVEQIPACPASR
jgi:hypothetical protein